MVKLAKMLSVEIGTLACAPKLSQFPLKEYSKNIISSRAKVLVT